MKKLISLLALFATISCAPFSGIETLYAQSFPISIHAEWTPNPTVDEVTSYTVTWTGPGGVGGAVTNKIDKVTPDLCSATLCKSPDFIVMGKGSVAASVTATNQWDTSTPTTTGITIAGPGKIATLKITK